MTGLTASIRGIVSRASRKIRLMVAGIAKLVSVIKSLYALAVTSPSNINDISLDSETKGNNTIINKIIERYCNSISSPYFPLPTLPRMRGKVHGLICP